jgi:subfamily B ATP-binding cassette protein HlyB/CyaB
VARAPGRVIDAAAAIQAEPPGEPAPALHDTQWAASLTGLRGLFLLALHHGTHLAPEQVAGAIADDMVQGVLRVLRHAGFEARAIDGAIWEDIEHLGSALPVLVVKRNGGFLILAGVLGSGAETQLAVLDPSREALGITLMTRANFLAEWRGTILLCRRPAMAQAAAPFGLGWFAAEIGRHGHILRDVTIAAVASSLIALAAPLLYHVLIDKVIPYHATQTLSTVLLVFGVVTCFDAVFCYARARLMLFLTNKVDAALAARVFEKMLALPMPFFEHLPAGVLVRHLQQTEKLRHFLTGRLFQCVLDSALLPVLLALMCVYSFPLTLLVMVFALAITGVIFILIPRFRVRLNALYAAEGARQGHLVETLHGIRTVKSLAMEKLRQHEWDNRVAAAITSQSQVGRTAAVANTLTMMLDKLMQISVLGLGVGMVFGGTMSIGALVAFTMLAQRVSGPLMQIVGLINEYQETAISVRMLGTVMDHEPERAPSARAIRPSMSGAVSFDQVSFRYPGAASLALDRVSFAAQEGQVIGVVGRSGSGKTTLIRLIQGIEAPQSGLIRFDGTDIRHIDLEHLRRNVGVVLQDSFLFRGTIRENIAAGKPNAHLGDVVEAARLAGADEFIDRLPLGYETKVEEGAANFSGGQKQRLSIARALLVRPRLLIFDEATSALDPESEAILQENLKQIAKGRTMIVVSHRLSSLVQADATLVLDHGGAVDFAPHSTLLQRCTIYRGLWEQQTRHMGAA